MKLETVRTLHRHIRAIDLALQKEIENADREQRECRHGHEPESCNICKPELLNANSR
jgi:hypothetical protein